MGLDNYSQNIFIWNTDKLNRKTPLQVDNSLRLK